MHNNDEGSFYNVHEDALVNELLEDISVSELRLLHAMLRELGHDGWMAWLLANLKETSQYVQASQMTRNNQSYADAETQLLLLYGAIHLAQRAGEMAHYFDNPDLLSDCTNPRHRRAARGHLLWQASFEPWNPWPFDEPVELGNPFVSDE